MYVLVHILRTGTDTSQHLLAGKQIRGHEFAADISEK